MARAFAGDAQRPEPASTGIVFGLGSAPTSRLAEAAAPASAIRPPWGGCGFVTVTPDLSPRASFQRFAVARTRSALFAVVQLCEYDPTTIVRLAVLRDGQPMAVPGTGFDTPVRLAAGETAALALPRGLIQRGHELQVIALRLDNPTGIAWFSHPFTVG